jgi:predicted MFS family arabinose efflux permease
MRARPGSASAVVVLMAMTLSTFIYVTAELLPIGLLPLIARDLDSTTSAVGMLVTAYGFVVVVASVPLTRLTQRVPRRRVLCVLMAVFTLATAASALAGSYWLLMAARIVTALSQALFWSVVTPATAALFRTELRPRMLSILYAGGSIAALAGVPIGTWIGQQTQWRTAFLALSGLGLLVLIAILALLPDTPAGESETDRGWAPDTGRYLALLVCTAFTVTGAFAAFTYISSFLTEVTGFTEGSLGPLLFVRGLAGLLGVAVVGAFIGRNGWLTVTALIGTQLIALTAQWVFAESQVVTVVAIALAGLALSGVASSLGVRVLEIAPRGTDVALAGASTAFNIGITAGALLGAVLLPHTGVRSTVLVGALITVVAFAVALAEPSVSSRRRAARPTRPAREPARR